MPGSEAFDAELVATIPVELRQTPRYFSFDTQRFDFRRAICTAIDAGDPTLLSALHTSTEGQARYSNNKNKQGAHGGRNCYNKRWRSKFATDKVFMRELIGCFVEEVIKPLLYAPEDGGQPEHQFVVYQAHPTLRVHFPGSKPLGGKHIDYSYKRQPTEINIWLPLTPVGGSNSLYSESAPGRQDFKPFEVDDFGTAVMFWGNQCEHYSTPNQTNTTRVSLDFRVIRGDLFVQEYIAPTDKRGFARFKLGQGYTDTVAEAGWRNKNSIGTAEGSATSEMDGIGYRKDKA
jgi:hypothetical protein